MPAQASVPWLSIVPIAESRSSYNGLLVFAVHRASRRRSRPTPSTASPRARCAARRPGTAAFPTRARRRSTPPAASRSRSAASSARSCSAPASSVEMPPPGDLRAGAPAPSSCAISSGTRSTRRSRAAVGVAADRLNRLQFLTIRRYLSLVFARSGRACSWCSRYGRDPRPRSSRARRCCWCCCWRRCSPASCARSRRGCCAAAARRCCSPIATSLRLLRKEVVLAENASWLFRVAPYLDLRRDLGRGRAGADLRHRPAVQLDGRSHRHHRAARQRALLPGARRHGCRHQLRRHRRRAAR